jgi:hypothetical protein
VTAAQEPVNAPPVAKSSLTNEPNKQHTYNTAFDELPADLKYFLHTHDMQCRAWVRTHGNTMFPIVKNEQTGLWVWINREQRRRIRKFGNKNGARL